MADQVTSPPPTSEASAAGEQSVRSNKTQETEDSFAGLYNNTAPADSNNGTGVEDTGAADGAAADTAGGSAAADAAGNTTQASATDLHLKTPPAKTYSLDDDSSVEEETVEEEEEIEEVADEEGDGEEEEVPTLPTVPDLDDSVAETASVLEDQLQHDNEAHNPPFPPVVENPTSEEYEELLSQQASEPPQKKLPQSAATKQQPGGAKNPSSTTKPTPVANNKNQKPGATRPAQQKPAQQKPAGGAKQTQQQKRPVGAKQPQQQRPAGRKTSAPAAAAANKPIKRQPPKTNTVNKQQTQKKAPQSQPPTRKATTAKAAVSQPAKTVTKRVATQPQGAIKKTSANPQPKQQQPARKPTTSNTTQLPRRPASVDPLLGSKKNLATSKANSPKPKTASRGVQATKGSPKKKSHRDYEEPSAESSSAQIITDSEETTTDETYWLNEYEKFNNKRSKYYNDYYDDPRADYYEDEYEEEPHEWGFNNCCCLWLICVILVLMSILSGFLINIITYNIVERRRNRSAPPTMPPTLLPTMSTPTPTTLQPTIFQEPTISNSPTASRAPSATYAPSLTLRARLYEQLTKTLLPQDIADLLKSEVAQSEGDYNKFIISMNDVIFPRVEALDWLSNDLYLETYPDEKIIQRYMLAVFYYSTGGDLWLNNDGWLSELDECLWYTSAEIICNGNGMVSNLQLDNNNLQGTIPPEVKLLSSTLRRFSIRSSDGNVDSATVGSRIGISARQASNIDSSNGFMSRPVLTSGGNIFGTIPTEIGLLSRLGTFALEGHNFDGANSSAGVDSRGIPTFFGRLSQLFQLELSDNGFSGNIPSELGNLKFLSVLDLSKNELSGQIPVELADLTKLTHLSLADNSFTGNADIGNGFPIEVISNFVNLQVLDLSTNALTSLPEDILDLADLRTLDVRQNSLGRRRRSNGRSERLEIPVEIFFLPSLQYLYLSQNEIIGTIPTAFGFLSELITLDISQNTFSGNVPSELGKLFKLKSLYLYDNDLSGLVPSELATLEDLNVIRLEKNSLTGSVPEAVCETFNAYLTVFFTDCVEEVKCSCCQYCCSDNSDECQCAAEFTDPLSCLVF